ncbi:putative cupredoxin-like copper-binding protein [Bradyrhizobium sp. AZCC 1693]
MRPKRTINEVKRSENMQKRYQTGVALLAAALLSASAWAGAGPKGHSHSHDEAFSAGEPGDPKKPARVVQVTMGEADGKMLFMPAKVEVKKGEQVKFVLRNNGELDHEFILATTAENLKHGEAMKKNPDMEHDDPNGKRLAPKKADEIVWKFTKAGQFEYSCLIPGHREAGMVGTVVVK